MGPRGTMRSVAEAGTTRVSSELSRVVRERCVDDTKIADRSQSGHKHTPRSRARPQVTIEKSGRKPLDHQIVDPLLTT